VRVELELGSISTLRVEDAESVELTYSGLDWSVHLQGYARDDDDPFAF